MFQPLSSKFFDLLVLMQVSNQQLQCLILHLCLKIHIHIIYYDIFKNKLYNLSRKYSLDVNLKLSFLFSSYAILIKSFCPSSPHASHSFGPTVIFSQFIGIKLFKYLRSNLLGAIFTCSLKKVYWS